MPDELDAILRLVVEGHLSASEAAPIVAALQARWHGAGAGGSRTSNGTPPGGGRSGSPGPRGAPSAGRSEDNPHLRIQVFEGDRAVVNLRVPLGLAGVAAARIPGIPFDYAERIRSAIALGTRGPILDVGGDDGDRVLIVVE